MYQQNNYMCKYMYMYMYVCDAMAEGLVQNYGQQLNIVTMQKLTVLFYWNQSYSRDAQTDIPH